MARLSYHFIISVYKLIFEQDPPCMSQEAMEALLNISYWYASPSGNFIGMFGGEKPPHVLPRFSTDNLVMQEVSYHIYIVLSTRLHKTKKAPWSDLPLRNGLCEIKSLKDEDVEAKDLKKFEFGTEDYNPYNPHYICKNHCAKVYCPWIHGTFHWEKEDHWRYYYNSSKLNE